MTTGSTHRFREDITRWCLARPLYTRERRDRTNAEKKKYHVIARGYHQPKAFTAVGIFADTSSSYPEDGLHACNNQAQDYEPTHVGFEDTLQ